MPDYLAQIAYNTEAVASLIENPHNREEAIRSVVEKFGGTVKGFWFSFGKFDGVAIITLPDNVSAVAFMMAAKASGAIKFGKTIPLLSAEEGIEAMKKASIGCDVCDALVSKK